MAVNRVVKEAQEELNNSSLPQLSQRLCDTNIATLLPRRALKQDVRLNDIQRLPPSFLLIIQIGFWSSVETATSSQQPKKNGNVVISTQARTTRVTFIQCGLGDIFAVKEATDQAASITNRLDILVCKGGMTPSYIRPPFPSPAYYQRHLID